MGKYSKVIGAAIGGGIVGTAGLPILPEGSSPWAYVALYAISVIVPAVAAYVAPKNSNS